MQDGKFTHVPAAGHAADGTTRLPVPTAIVFRSSGLHTLDTYKPTTTSKARRRTTQHTSATLPAAGVLLSSLLEARTRPAGFDAAVLEQAAAAAAAQQLSKHPMQDVTAAAHTSRVPQLAQQAQQHGQSKHQNEQQQQLQQQQEQEQQQLQATLRRKATLRAAGDDHIEIIAAPVLPSRSQEPQSQHALTAPGQVVAAAYGNTITSSNIGFQLLRKAGWQEGSGLGVQQQGRVAPIPASSQRGNRGLGFDSDAAQAQQAALRQAVQAQLAIQQQKQQQQRHQLVQTGEGGGHAAVVSSATAIDAPKIGPQLQVLGKRQRTLLIQAELDSEDMDTKVKRYQQIARQEAEDAKVRSIRSYLSHAFNEVELSADVNPLSRPNRLTASNPLLDNDL